MPRQRTHPQSSVPSRRSMVTAIEYHALDCSTLLYWTPVAGIRGESSFKTDFQSPERLSEPVWTYDVREAMAGLLPTSPEVSVEQSGDPKLVCLDDEKATELLSTLSSETSQAVFRRVAEEPMAAADVAADLDMSVQAVSYHLGNLQDAGLIEVLDTCYSEKGRSVDVYGAAEDPYLLFLGASTDQPGLTAAFKQFAAAIGPAGIALAVAGALSNVFGAE